MFRTFYTNIWSSLKTFWWQGVVKWLLLHLLIFLLVLVLVFVPVQPLFVKFDHNLKKNTSSYWLRSLEITVHGNGENVQKKVLPWETTFENYRVSIRNIYSFWNKVKQCEAWREQFRWNSFRGVKHLLRFCLVIYTARVNQEENRTYIFMR